MLFNTCNLEGRLMSVFISDMFIKSYRGISSLELKDLASVNIITGDNNSGKTSVLELLKSIENPGDFNVWRTLIRRDNYSIRRGMTYFEGFYDLFNVDSDNKNVAYSISINGVKEDIYMQGKVTEEELLESEINKMLGYVYGRNSNDDDNLQSILKLELDMNINDNKCFSQEIYEGQIQFKSRHQNETNRRNVIYISPTRHADGMVYLNAMLENAELYEQLLEVLKQYDEDIVSINYDNSEKNISGRGVYKILSKAHKKALPLNVYGDGMKKAVLIMSAAIAAKDGVLLIDEFETAIHTSAMEKTFKWIIETCKKLNVQVFLTSHSKEAIEKLLKCSSECIDDIAVYTLSKRENRTAVRRLDGRKAIELQDNMGLELR